MEATTESHLPLFSIILGIHLVSMIGCLIGIDTRVDGDKFASIFLSAWIPGAALFATVIVLAQLLQDQSWFLLPPDSLLHFSSVTLWLLAGAQLWILFWIIPRIPFFLRFLPYVGLLLAAFFLRH